MTGADADVLSEVVRAAARPLAGGAADYDALLERIGDARFVLLGEASHGTEEFYRARAEITERLIREKGFAAVAVEADWPDAYRVNRYVRGEGEDEDGRAALGGFARFPTWMWRNTAVLDFVERLKGHNLSTADEAARAGFYGIDLYSLRGSVEAVLDYLDRVDPEAAGRARQRYSCFDYFGDPQAYGYAAAFGVEEPCEGAVVEQLIELRRRAPDYANRDGSVARDEFFAAFQNARLVKNAEEYYRSMFRGRAESWNRRDRHMAETLEALAAHLESQGRVAKVVVWAHNSHLGDARHTEMGEGGELNVGQLVRERHGRDAVLVGFTTHAGTVTAADDWGQPARRIRVRPALEGSYELLFHRTGLGRFYLDLGAAGRASDLLRRPRLERAIGVIYRPETERQSHYFQARLAEQFDVVFHFDETRAVTPLEPGSGWRDGEPPETYPSGF
ncbi:MAG TPA: erythromycin esterase family protein [Pyrinomonadaceae bacterium]|nr:erythromycin esterase family protein [Pyrinomonadaceae bacterium]